MGKPTVYYFGVRARGQYIITLLKYLKVDFEHVELKGFPDEIKNKCTFGQVPLYIDENIQLCQTHAIARYISIKNNIYGKDLVETARIDEIVESFWDCINPILQAHFKFDEKGKEEFRKNNKVAVFLQAYENKLNQHKYMAGGSGYTYADIGTFITYDYADTMGFVGDTSKYPKLEELRKYFKSLPQLKEYFDSIKDLKL